MRQHVLRAAELQGPLQVAARLVGDVRLAGDALHQGVVAVGERVQQRLGVVGVEAQ